MQRPHPPGKRPGFLLPPGSCDTHCHIFGPVARFPFAPGHRYAPPDATKEDLQALHRVLGVDRVVFVQPTSYGHDHAALSDAIAARNGQARGVALVSDKTDDAELQRLHDAGFRGARFHIVGHHNDFAAPIDEIQRTAARVRSLGWHMVFQVDPDKLIEHRQMLLGLPGPVVIDHLARLRPELGIDQPAMSALLALLDSGRFWVKLSCHERLSKAAMPYPDTAEIARFLVSRAPRRVLWGTDWPHANFSAEMQMPDDADLVDLVAGIASTESERRRLLVDNPLELYDFAPLPAR